MKPAILLRIGDRVINTDHVAGVQRLPSREVIVYLAYTDLAEPGDFVFRGLEAEAVWNHFCASAVDVRIPPMKSEVA